MVILSLFWALIWLSAIAGALLSTNKRVHNYSLTLLFFSTLGYGIQNGVLLLMEPEFRQPWNWARALVAIFAPFIAIALAKTRRKSAHKKLSR